MSAVDLYHTELYNTTNLWEKILYWSSNNGIFFKKARMVQ